MHAVSLPRWKKISETVLRGPVGSQAGQLRLLADHA